MSIEREAMVQPKCSFCGRGAKAVMRSNVQVECTRDARISQQLGQYASATHAASVAICSECASKFVRELR